MNSNASWLEKQLIEYFEQKGWINTQKYKITYYYEFEKNWFGFAQNKTYFSLYLANYWPLYDQLKRFESKKITFSKSAMQIRQNNDCEEEIYQTIINYLENADDEIKFLTT